MQMNLHTSRIFAQAVEQIWYLHPFCILLVWVFPTGLVNLCAGSRSLEKTPGVAKSAPAAVHWYQLHR